jgi:translation initiation factor IF-3
VRKIFKINEEITAGKVKVIDTEGTFIGIVDLKQAIQLASSQGMDLVEISSADEEPLCKICNASKFIAKSKQKEKDIKKNTKILTVKELRIRPATGTHDIDIKVNHAIKFLNKGHNVIFCMRFKGREKLHIDQGKELLNKVIERLNEYAQAQSQELKMINNQIVVKFDPIKNKK